MCCPLLNKIHSLHLSGAIKLLGEPIKQLGFDYTNKDNYCDGRSARYHVRVKGPNDKGMVKVIV